MTTLPSFVELMSSLDKHSERSSSPTSTSSSAPSSPHPVTTRPILQDHISPSRHRVARYSPYLLFTRRGSLPSASHTTTEFHQPRASSTSPRLLSSPGVRKRNGTTLSTNIYGSVSDLTANTPISTYVRRKTPSISPTSPTFPPDDSATSSLMPFSLPTLPSLFPQAMDYYSFPPMPKADMQQPSEYKSYHSKFLPENLGDYRFYSHASVRISTPPRFTDMNHPRSQLAQVG